MDGLIGSLPAIGFANPWLLAALVALPVLVWLLRVTPPAPKLLAFPAVRLLLDIPRRDETAARTPWWLLLLRILAAALVIIGLARPVLNAGGAGGGAGPLLIVVDDGWAAGQAWAQRVAALDTALDRADRAGRPVMLLATAPGDRGEPPRVTAAMPAQEMRERVAALRPRPWAPDRATARRAVEQLGRGAAGLSVLWVADGLSHGNGEDAEALGAALAALGPLSVLTPPPGALPVVLGTPASEPGRIVARVASLPAPAEQEIAVLARTADGRTLARATATLAPGATSLEIPVALPPELRNRLATLVVEGSANAAAVSLLDERWRRRPPPTPLGARPGDRAPRRRGRGTRGPGPWRALDQRRDRARPGRGWGGARGGPRRARAAHGGHAAALRPAARARRSVLRAGADRRARRRPAGRGRPRGRRARPHRRGPHARPRRGHAAGRAGEP